MEILLSLENVAERLPNLGKAGMIAVLALALLNCFFGYKLMKLLMAVFGIFAGGALGYFLTSAFTESSWLPYVAMVAGAAVFGGLAFWIYQAGVFLLCGAVGTLACSFLIRPKSSLMFFLCMFLGACVGMLGVKFVKPMVIFLTSLHGGFTLGVLGSHFFKLDRPGMAIVIGVVFTVMGALFQMATNRKAAEAEEEEE